MSFLDYEATDPVPLSRAGGAAAFGVPSVSDILKAADDDQRFVNNQRSTVDAMYEGIERTNRAIEAGTGQKLSNPFDEPEAPPLVDNEGHIIRPDTETLLDRLNKWQEQREKIARDVPGSAAFARPGTSVTDLAQEVALESDARLARYMQARPGITSTLAMFAGSMIGYMRDPLQAGMSFVGGGPTGAGSLAARTATWAAREFVINAGSQAVVEPSVQKWREELGLPHGFSEAVKNVLFAGAFGAAIPVGAGAVGATVRGARRFLSPPPLPAEVLEQLPAPIREALDNPKKAAELLQPVRDHLPPEDRAAIDHVDVPEPGDPKKLSEAVNYAEDQTRNVQWLETVRREMRAEMGPRPKRASPETTIQYLARHGGLAPDPELTKRDLHLVSAGGGRDRAGKRIPPRKLVREGGMSLNDARQFLIEDERLRDAGRDNGGQLTTTEAEVLAILDEEQSGRPNYSAKDADAVEQRRIHEAHIEAENDLIRAIEELSGVMTEGLPKAMTRRAVEIKLDDPGLDPEEAILRASRELEDEHAFTPTRANTDEPIPFFDDEPGGLPVERAAGGNPFGEGAGPLPEGRAQTDIGGLRVAGEIPARTHGAPEEIGFDDPNAPEALAFNDAMLKELDPDGSYVETMRTQDGDLDAIVTYIDRAGDMIDLVKSCKVM